jgi:hypothetical protein
MKKIVFAAAVLMIGTSAHAGTYNYDGVTIHVQDGCRSSSCVAVYAPGYGYYNGGRTVKVRKAHKDTARVAAARKEDTAPATAAAKAPAADVQATPSDAAPAK